MVNGTVPITLENLGQIRRDPRCSAENFVLDSCDDAARELESAFGAEGGGAVDEHTMDQLVLYMALAAGESRVLCNAPTSISSLHLETAIQLCSTLTGATFKVDPRPSTLFPAIDSCPRLVTCSGSPAQTAGVGARSDVNQTPM